MAKRGQQQTRQPSQVTPLTQKNKVDKFTPADPLFNLRSSIRNQKAFNLFDADSYIILQYAQTINTSIRIKSSYDLILI